jgi:small subunit ribosomal protein S1
MSDGTEPEVNEPETTVPKRRIPIGTQRDGVLPPSLSPTVEYVTSPVKETVAATDTNSIDQAQPKAAKTVSSDLPKEQESPRKRKRRQSNREKKERSALFSHAIIPKKQVDVPNLRASLDEDLDADFEAAIDGVAVDDLLERSIPNTTVKPLEPGQRISGTILSIGHDTIFIDLGGQRQGAMKLVGFVEQDEEIPVVGQTIEVGIGSLNKEDGLYEVAPANRAIAVEDWSQLEVGMIVECRVSGTNKGGLECEVGGLRGFMPAGAVSPWRVENLEEMVGQTLESLVTELVPSARRLVLSRRAVLERQAADARAKMLETLQIGEQLDGIVRNIRDFGVFVDIGNGVEGLVHVSQLSWDRISKPADVMQLGQKVRVVIKKVDRQTGKIGLSVRDLIESPWTKATDKYHSGATVKGTVSRIADFGAFVRLEAGIEGLIHVSELATRRIRSVSDVVKEGDVIECRVLSVDADEQRMSLSIKALQTKTSELESSSDTEQQIEEMPPVKKKRNTPLKGGLGGNSDGDRFGLKW